MEMNIQFINTSRLSFGIDQTVAIQMLVYKILIQSEYLVIWCIILTNRPFHFTSFHTLYGWK
ncbi:hypothetical protein BC833DRAFT_590612 [Globomyces pollinis-pini]|nr:hypothetical protein BC833DRAFT_590612 [Globomyces pollinis-pini]